MDRFRRLSVRDRRLAGAAVVAAAIVVLGAGVLLTSAPTPGPGIVAASPSGGATASLGIGVGASAGSTAVPTPGTSPDGQWASLDGPAFQPLVTLTADASDASGVAPTTSFTLHATSPLDAASLAGSLQVSPALPFTVVPGADATSATIRPVGSLTTGSTYRFALAGAQGATLGSWTFAVRQPLHVATILPDDQTTGVPLDTGIEITFDQDGATDVASHVKIDPPIAGHTETHGRTFVFVPDRLAERTVYTVTVRAGIGIAGSDQVLARDVHFAFETGSADDTVRPVSVSSERLVLETSPRERTTMIVDVDVPDGAKPISTLPVSVYRLGSQAAALSALRALIEAPTWATYSSAGAVDTSRLSRVASFTAHLGEFGAESYSRWFRFPTRLPAGWYIVDLVRPERDTQVFLQVTDLATYAVITSTRSVVWVNDTATHATSRGARVGLAGGADLGRTDVSGIVVATTPKVVLDRLTGSNPAIDAPILVVRASGGRTALVPAGFTDVSGAHYVSDIGGDGTSTAARFFHLIYTDRSTYRQTDQVNVWGLVRTRDRTALPGKVELRLTNPNFPDDPAIVTVPLTLGTDGSFKASIPIADYPIGSYSVDVRVGQIDLDSAGFYVDVIRKPAYQILVSTDRHAVLVGDTVTVTSHLAFYDGTAVPNTQVQAEDVNHEDQIKTGTTDGAGVAVFKLPARVQDTNAGFSVAGMNVATVGPEEGGISSFSDVMVFPSSLWLDGKVVVSGGRIVLNGSVHDVDLAGLERKAATIADPDANLYGLDPRGRARPGLTVDAAISELVPVRTFAGRTYDFITKLAVDTYTYSIRYDSLGTRHLVSGPGGKIHLALPVSHPNHDYRVILTVRDSAHRAASLELDAAIPPTPVAPDLRPHLTGAEPCGYDRTAATTFGVGQTVRTTMANSLGALPSGGPNRYLFVTAQGGLRSTKVQTSPRFSASFRNADIPNLSILGVRFTGTSYAPASDLYQARFDPSARALSVQLSTDAASYRPGGLVSLTVVTRDAAGHPVPATVTLRAVDQKLYATGLASDVDALGDLYTEVPDGIVHAHASRSEAFPESEGGCGATGGGGRDDFRDSVLFRTVTTNASGRGSIAFAASDDLTSWHLSATAVSATLQAGSGSILIPVSLPFFADAGLAPEYLVGDRPSVRVRAFGSALHAGDPITFTVSSTTLPMAPTTVHGTAFDPFDVPLPALHPGDQTVTITATSGTGATMHSDALTRHFQVVATRLLTPTMSYATVTAGLAPAHGDGLTSYVFSDTGRGQYLAFLQGAVASDGVRLDQALARAVAHDLMARYFPAAVDVAGDGSSTSTTFDPNRYQADTGLGLLPYSGADLELTADAVLVARDRFQASNLRDYFQSFIDDSGSTREQRTIALAGLAGLGDAVMGDVRLAATTSDLSPTEQLYLGLAAAALGDSTTALSMETALLHAFGQRQGPWVRLAVGIAPDEAVRGTALLAMLAAELGDPIAGAAEAWVSTHPATDSVTSLFGIGYVEAAIAHASAAPASFAYTVAGDRRVRDLAPGEAFQVTLNGDQAASLRVDPASGSVGVASTWEAPTNLSTAPKDPIVTSFSRSSTPSGTLASSAVVAVTLTLEVSGTLADNECYEVTDLAPSGFAPVARLEDWPPAEDAGTPAPDVIDPYAIEGQRVRFCAMPAPKSNTMTMRYYMRVVTVGTYLWEPAVAASSLAPDGVARTDRATVVVR